MQDKCSILPPDLLTWFLLSAIAPVLALAAQSPTATFSTDVRVVSLFAVARDSSGLIYNNLSKDDFRLQVDDQPQAIKYFSRQTDLPLTLGMLMDTSASMLRVFDPERTAADQFLKEVLREKTDQGFVISFGRNVQLLQPMTSSRRRLRGALGVLDSQTWFQRQAQDQRPTASTAFYDAAVAAAHQYRNAQRERNILVVLSDGIDDGSANTLNSATEAALRAGVRIYSIHIFAPEPEFTKALVPRLRDQLRQKAITRGKDALLRLSHQTGGSFLEATNARNLQAIFSEVQNELRNQYSLGFTPSGESSKPGFHSVLLTATRNGITVQTSAGYFVGP